MRPHVIFRYVGIVLLFNALFLFISTLIAGFNHASDFFPLLYSTFVAVLFGIFPLVFVPSTTYISNDEGLVIVISSWFLSCLVGVLPYVLYGGEFTFTDAWFESVSGFTTTGSSILKDIQAMPIGLLFWRSATHWIGGIGIIVFVLSVLPTIGQAAMVLYRSEMSPLAAENFQYRTQKTLQILMVIYVGLTLLETIALMICGLDLFDAVTHSFGTIATGGFSTKNLSIAHFESVAVEVVVIIFMILSGINFGLLFLAVTGKIQRIWRSAAVRYYIGALVIGTVCVAFNINGKIYQNWLDALRYAAFQVVSLGTSTGFATTDTAVWPALAILVMIFFTLQCACAGSTSGGIKVDRMVIFWKSIKVRIAKLKHPKAVIALKIEHAVVNDETVTTSLLFISMYIGIVFMSTLLLASIGVDLLTAFSGSAAAMGNVGPGFGMVTSLGNYSQIPTAGKWILTIVMLLGRLEIFGLILFLMIKTRK